MSTQNPDEIQENIERTRQDLREDVDALQEKVSIKGAAGRRAERMKESVTQMRDTVMGSAQTGMTSAREAMHSAGDSAAQIPSTARRTTSGNPLAVGLGAFALGWLIGSLLPASDREKQVVTEATEKADLATPLRDVVGQAQDAGKHALHEVAQEVKAGAAEVKESVQR